MPGTDYLVLPVRDNDFWVVATLGTCGRAALAVPTEAMAHEVVTILQSATDDLPSRMAWVQMDMLGSAELSAIEYSTDFHDWAALGAPARSLNISGLVGEVLGGADVPGDGTPAGWNFWQPLQRALERLAELPDDVAAAVKAELVRRVTPYDGVPVLMAAYDRKEGAGWTVLSANPVMDLAVDPQNPEELLDPLSCDFGADMRELERAWDCGELGVVMNMSTFIGWHNAFGAAV
jgi:hypothetical protein